MNYLKLTLMGLLMPIISYGQSETSRKFIPFSVGYWGEHFGSHPGFKVAAQFDLYNWEKVKEKKKRTKTKYKSIFAAPQVGYYVHPGNHHGLLLGAEVGYRRLKQRSGLYFAWSIGAAYLQQFNSGTTYYVEENGSLTQKGAASRLYFLPTLNYEFGQQINSKIGWYSKYSVGAKMPYNTGIAMSTFLELGLKLNPFKTKK